MVAHQITVLHYRPPLSKTGLPGVRAKQTNCFVITLLETLRIYQVSRTLSVNVTDMDRQARRGTHARGPGLPAHTSASPRAHTMHTHHEIPLSGMHHPPFMPPTLSANSHSAVSLTQ